jgi:predicted phosphoribosyltransferase
MIVAAVGPAVEKQAFEAASRRQHMTEGELQQEEAREREAEIERIRRRYFANREGCKRH